MLVCPKGTPSVMFYLDLKFIYSVAHRQLLLKLRRRLNFLGDTHRSVTPTPTILIAVNCVLAYAKARQESNTLQQQRGYSN